MALLTGNSFQRGGKLTLYLSRAPALKNKISWNSCNIGDTVRQASWRSQRRTDKILPFKWGDYFKCNWKLTTNLVWRLGQVCANLNRKNKIDERKSRVKDIQMYHLWIAYSKRVLIKKIKWFKLREVSKDTVAAKLSLTSKLANTLNKYNEVNKAVLLFC